MPSLTYEEEYRKQYQKARKRGYHRSEARRYAEDHTGLPTHDTDSRHSVWRTGQERLEEDMANLYMTDSDRKNRRCNQAQASRCYAPRGMYSACLHDLGWGFNVCEMTPNSTKRSKVRSQHIPYLDEDIGDGEEWCWDSSDNVPPPIRRSHTFCGRSTEKANGYNVEGIRPKRPSARTSNSEKRAKGSSSRENGERPTARKYHTEYIARSKHEAQAGHGQRYAHNSSFQGSSLPSHGMYIPKNPLPSYGAYHASPNPWYHAQPTYNTHYAASGHYSQHPQNPAPNYSTPNHGYKTRTFVPETPPQPEPSNLSGTVPKYDLYTILGVSSSATHEEMKSAHRKLSLKFHPDRVKGDDKENANDQMAEINQAYDVLKNPEARRRYDKTGRVYNMA